MSATAKYGPTPPRIFPIPSGEVPEKPNGGTLVTLTSETMEMAVTADATVTDLALVLLLVDRTLQVEVFVEAHDPAGGGRSATGYAELKVTRRGSAAPTIMGTPVMLTYDPFSAPWNTITADLVVVGNNIAVRVTGLAATSIRWRATVKVIGAQAQLTS